MRSSIQTEIVFQLHPHGNVSAVLYGWNEFYLSRRRDRLLGQPMRKRFNRTDVDDAAAGGENNFENNRAYGHRLASRIGVRLPCQRFSLLRRHRRSVYLRLGHSAGRHQHEAREYTQMLFHAENLLNRQNSKVRACSSACFHTVSLPLDSATSSRSFPFL